MSGWLVALGGCIAPEPQDFHPRPPPAPQPEPVLLQTGETGIRPTDSGTEIPLPPQCDEVASGPFEWYSTGAINTEEDFDFDRSGYLVYQSYSDLVGMTRLGDMTLLATNIGQDIAGVRTLGTDDYVVAQQDTAALRRVNKSTGNTVTVLGGLDYPNGLDVGVDGMVYVSEYSNNGRVRMVDPYSGDATVIFDGDYPNGLALSPDEQVLYIALSQSLFQGNGRVVAIDRDPTTGDWLPEPRQVYAAGDLLDAITVDVCGNVYVTEYNSGKVWRIAMPSGEAELIVDLPNSGFEGYCAARFGAGYGDWSRTVLYVSDRSDLYGIELGIEGRHVLAAP